MNKGQHTNSTYSLELVLSASVTAYFQQNETYTSNGPLTNKNIVLSILGEFYTSSATDTIYVDATTDKHVKVAKDMVVFYKGLALKAMGGKINDFEQKILEIIKRETVDKHEVGVVASLPKSYFRAIKRETTNNELLKLSSSSQHVGKEREALSLNIDVKSCSYIQSLNCHVVNAVDKKGNIIVFFTGKSPDEFKGNVDITCKIKRHQVSKMHGGKETVVNYVKVIN
jgi:putative lipoic acid-binding regulatory protein